MLREELLRRFAGRVDLAVDTRTLFPRELVQHMFLVTDPCGEDVIVLTIGSDIAPLRLNMLQPPAATRP